MREFSISKTLDWVDQRKPLQFLAILYVARWIVVAPLFPLNRILFSSETLEKGSVEASQFSQGPVLLLFIFVILAPLIETLIECLLPYFIVSRVRNYRDSRPERCWGFIAISACAMGVYHPMLSAIVPALITGTFLAYCYAHFAEKSIWQAILATIGFHGAINLVGWAIVVMQQSIQGG